MIGFGYTSLYHASEGRRKHCIVFEGFKRDISQKIQSSEPGLAEEGRAGGAVIGKV